MLITNNFVPFDDFNTGTENDDGDENGGDNFNGAVIDTDSATNNDIDAVTDNGADILTDTLTDNDNDSTIIVHKNDCMLIW